MQTSSSPDFEPLPTPSPSEHAATPVRCRTRSASCSSDDFSRKRPKTAEGHHPLGTLNNNPSYDALCTSLSNLNSNSISEPITVNILSPDDAPEDVSFNAPTLELLPTPASLQRSSLSTPSNSSQSGGTTPASSSPPPPSQDAIPRPKATKLDPKSKFVSGLVGASVIAIESIWGPQKAEITRVPEKENVLPLQVFIREVLRRSRTSCSTLQIALYYLHKCRREIRLAVAKYFQLSQSKEYPTPPGSPVDSTSTGFRKVDSISAANNPVLCGRRMFLAALISASKFLQDRNYSSRAWSKISGLSVHEINTNERAFLRLMSFQLHVGADQFRLWSERLALLACQDVALEYSQSAASGLIRQSSEILPEPRMDDIRVADPNQTVTAKPPLRRALSESDAMTLRSSRVALPVPSRSPVNVKSTKPEEKSNDFINSPESLTVGEGEIKSFEEELGPVSTKAPEPSQEPTKRLEHVKTSRVIECKGHVGSQGPSAVTSTPRISPRYAHSTQQWRASDNWISAH